MTNVERDRQQVLLKVRARGKGRNGTFTEPARLFIRHDRTPLTSNS